MINFRTLVPDGCNFTSEAFRRGVRDFMRRELSMVHRDLLPADEEWERIHTCSSGRFEVRELEGWGWYILDTEENRWHTEYGSGDEGLPEGADCFDKEWKADEWATELEAEHETLYGFPFAHSYCYLPEDRIQTEDLVAAGFLVYEVRGFRVAGIDGGGYSFEGQHFAKLYALVAQRYGWKVETEAGPSLVEVS